MYFFDHIKFISEEDDISDEMNDAMNEEIKEMCKICSNCKITDCLAAGVDCAIIAASLQNQIGNHIK